MSGQANGFRSQPGVNVSKCFSEQLPAISSQNSAHKNGIQPFIYDSKAQSKLSQQQNIYYHLRPISKPTILKNCYRNGDRPPGTEPKPEIRLVLNPQQTLPNSAHLSSTSLSHSLPSQPITFGSLWCWSCCCCFAPFWYQANCNIHRVIALICNLFVNLLMVLCLLSTNWLTTTKYRQGLWQYCIDPESPRPLPFGIEAHDGCHWGRDAAYIKLAGFFAVACFLLSLIATVLTSFGLSTRDPNKKYTFYRFALYINLAALLSVIVALTLYPAFFYTELHHTNAVPSNRPHWYFGWAYGVGWGSAIFLIGAVLLLVCDKETEEIYYKERTIVQANGHHHLPYQQQQQLLRNQMYIMPPQMVKT